MSTLESDGWHVDETLRFFSILQSVKELNGSVTMRDLDWHYVASQMAESKTHHNGSRSISELREKYKKLRADYLSAVLSDRSCHYFNNLKYLFGDELSQEQEAEQEEYEEEVPQEEHIEVEQKHSHTLKFNGDKTNHSLDSVAMRLWRCKWADGEVEAFLKIITSLKLKTALLRPRNAQVFKLISREMAKHNFIKRPDQLRIKYHQLRRQYAKAKRGGESFEYYDDMHALLNGTEQHAESSGGELESDLNESEEEEEHDVAARETKSESEAIPTNVRVKWAEGEVDVFLDIIKHMGLESALLRKRNAKIFRLLSKEMAKRSFEKGPEKLRIKFQHLRRQYNKVKAGGETFEHYEAMHQLLNPAKKPSADIESNFSSASESDYICSDEDEAESNQRKRDTDTYFWTDHEVDAFLSIIKQHNLFRALDGSKKRNFKTLAYISNIMGKQSYQRTAHQLRNKWRLLLRRYGEVQKNGLHNVRMLSRHFEMLNELMQKKHLPKTRADANDSKVKATPAKPVQAPPLESDNEASSSDSSCDLMRAAAESEDFEDTFEMARELTPLEVLTSISEGQKELISTLKDSHERFLQQQSDMQKQFLHELSQIMRQEREATFRMLRELIQPK